MLQDAKCQIKRDGFSEFEIKEFESFLIANSQFLFKYANADGYKSFIKDGNAKNDVENIKIVKAKYFRDFSLVLTFASGEMRLFNADALKGKTYDSLRDESIFKNFKVACGTIFWLDEQINCTAEFLYENSCPTKLIPESIFTEFKLK